MDLAKWVPGFSLEYCQGLDITLQSRIRSFLAGAGARPHLLLQKRPRWSEGKNVT